MCRPRQVQGQKSKQAPDCFRACVPTAINNTNKKDAEIKGENRYGRKTITAAGKKYKPSDVFSDESNYFITFTVRKMDEDVTSSWDVKANYITPDGTKVVGDRSCNYYIPSK